jgi:hypothetical protein
MKRGPLLCVIAFPIVAVVAVFLVSGSLDKARRPAREMRALSVAYELINTTNSTLLDGTSPEFTADLASVLASPTWRMVDRSPPADRRGVIRLILTNDHGQALHMRLQDERGSGDFRFRLLSYQRITESGSQED